MKFGSKREAHVVDALIGAFVSIGKIPKIVVASARGIARAWLWLIRLDWRLLIRRALKVITVALVLYAMMALLYPTQYRGWQLWLGPSETPLAKATAVVLVGFNAMILTLVREAWDNRHRGLALGGGLLGVMLMIVVLGGSWNYYTATSSRAVNVSSTATTGASSRVSEAQAKLDKFDKQSAADAATFTTKIANADPRYVTATSRMIAAAKEANAAAAGQRELLVSELNDARSGDVSANATQFDPRPIDTTMAAWFHLDRLFMGSINDLARALCFELLAIFGLALSMSAALSDVGVASSAGDKQKADAVSAAPAAKRDPEPELDPGLPDLRDEPFAPSRAAEDNRRFAAARKGWATKRAKEDEVQAPLGTDDGRQAGLDFTAGGPQEMEGNGEEQQPIELAEAHIEGFDEGRPHSIAGAAIGRDGDGTAQQASFGDALAFEGAIDDDLTVTEHDLPESEEDPDDEPVIVLEPEDEEVAA